MIQYFLFDLDGTLTNPKTGITKAVQYALNKYGIEVDNLDDLCKFIGPPLRDSFKIFYGFNDEEAENATAFYREYYSVKGLYENNIYDGINEMLQSLKENKKIMLVATSKPTVYAEKILEHFNIREYFAFVSGCELDGTRSTKSEVIRYALEQYNITDLEKVIMIGDREHDIIGAKKAGVLSVGVLYGFGDYDELQKAGADYIVKDTKELAEKLNSV